MLRSLLSPSVLQRVHQSNRNKSDRNLTCLIKLSVDVSILVIKPHYTHSALSIAQGIPATFAQVTLCVWWIEKWNPQCSVYSHIFIHLSFLSPPDATGCLFCQYFVRKSLRDRAGTGMGLCINWEECLLRQMCDHFNKYLEQACFSSAALFTKLKMQSSDNKKDSFSLI